MGAAQPGYSATYDGNPRTPSASDPRSPASSRILKKTNCGSFWTTTTTAVSIGPCWTCPLPSASAGRGPATRPAAHQSRWCHECLSEPQNRRTESPLERTPMSKPEEPQVEDPVVRFRSPAPLPRRRPMCQRSPSQRTGPLPLDLLFSQREFLTVNANISKN